jgi:hypothetical protein
MPHQRMRADLKSKAHPYQWRWHHAYGTLASIWIKDSCNKPSNLRTYLNSGRNGQTIGCLIAPYGFYDSPQKPSFFKIAPEIRPKCSAEAQVLDYMSTCFQMSQKGWALF